MTKITQFYSHSEPIIGTIVFIKSVQHKMKSENGVYVEMIEYNNDEGFIPCTEINRWKVNLNTFFKYDKIYPCIVLRKTNNISNKYDLSYIKVRKSDIALLEEAHLSKLKIINIIEKLSNDLNLSQDDKTKLCENTIYKILSPNIYDQVISNKKNIVKDKLDEILLNPEILFENTYNDEEKLIFVNTIKNRIKIKPMSLIKEFTFTIIEDDSLNKLKKIFESAQEKINNSGHNSGHNSIQNLNFGCRSSPKYYIQSNGNDKNILEQNIKFACEIFNNIIQDYNTICDMTSEPEIIKEIELLFL